MTPRLTWWNPDTMTFSVDGYAELLCAQDIMRGACIVGSHPLWARRAMTRRLERTRFAR